MGTSVLREIVLSHHLSGKASTDYPGQPETSSSRMGMLRSSVCTQVADGDQCWHSACFLLFCLFLFVLFRFLFSLGLQPIPQHHSYSRRVFPSQVDLSGNILKDRLRDVSPT